MSPSPANPLPTNSATSVGAHPFAALLQQPHAAIFRADATGRFKEVSRRWCEMLGYEEAELLKISIFEITHPKSIDDTSRNVKRLQSDQSAPYFILDKRFLRKDGTDFWGTAIVTATRNATGAVDDFVGMISDLSPQQRGRLLVESQNEALRLIIAGAPLADVFASLIDGVETDSDSVGSILFFDAEKRRLRHGSAPRLPEAFNRLVEEIPTGEVIGTCADAAIRNEVVITSDLANAPTWKDFKHWPLSLGLRAVWSMPIVSSAGQVVGTFGTYFRQRREPTPAEIETKAVLVKIAALAIEREKTERSLIDATTSSDRSRRLYETALSNTPDLVYVFNREHRFVFANAALLSMWGKTWDEAIGKNCLELGYEPWHAAMHDREIEEVIATKKPIRGEVAFNGTNGRRLYDYIFAPVFGANGEVEAISGTTRDVTEKRKSDAALQFLGSLARDLAGMSDEREILRHTASILGRHLNAHRCYFIECLERENRAQVSEDWVRDRAGTLTGILPLHDFGGREWWAAFSQGNFAVENTARHPFISPSEAANYAKLHVISYAAQPVKRTSEWGIFLSVSDDQPRIWTVDEMRLIEDVASRVWPLVERARSEVNLRLARDEALAASRAKDDFLAALSHELRTPLNPVLLLASEAMENPQLAPEVRADFETIVRNVTLEKRLIDDLLDVTSITHRKLTLDIAPQDIHGLLQQAINHVSPDAKQKNLQVTTSFAAMRSTVNGDGVRLQQVFWNLLKNAVKFTPPGGTISVRTQIDSQRLDHVIIEVADSGIGLTEAEMKKVFAPFIQGDHSETQAAMAYGGLGLGLAISKQLAELHHGSIRLQSAGRGQGATFTVELPLAPATVETTPQIEPAVVPKTRAMVPGVRSVLLVEDHEPSRIALARLLNNRQINVVHAASVAEALEKAALGPVDLVISDIGLPDGDGYELMHALKARHGFVGIALSGYGADADISRSHEAGFLAHLTKPVKIQLLESVLEKHVASFLPRG